MAQQQIDHETFEELKKTSGEDFIVELVDTFLEDAPKIFSELKSALKKGDADGFRRAAHSLKSNGATFGAGRFADLARELEMIGKERRLSDTGEKIQALEATFKLVADELKGLRA